MAHRKINASDIFEVYRSSYKIQCNWNECFDEDVMDWINIYEKAHNCSKDLILPSLIAMTAAFCGPKTRVLGNGDAFSTTLNSFIFAVADPGAGKSTVYDRVMEPVFDKYTSITGKNIQVENYTTAGIHKHQIENCGYGLITSDEGHRFLSSIQNKQGKGEGEKAFLCKLWNGKGDSTSLSNGTRGFKETSLSSFIMIHPNHSYQS